MFGKSLKINFLLGTLIGILGLFFSGGTPSTLATSTTDNFIPTRNITTGTLTIPEGIAVDSEGNIWITHYGTNSVSKLDSSGKPLSPTGGFTGGGRISHWALPSTPGVMSGWSMKATVTDAIIAKNMAAIIV